MTNDLKITCPKCKESFDAADAFNAHYKNTQIETEKRIKTRHLNGIDHELGKINKILNKNKFNNKISLALNEIADAIIKYKKNKNIKINTKHLNKLWGIYTQNCCIVKIK